MLYLAGMFCDCMHHGLLNSLSKQTNMPQLLCRLSLAQRCVASFHTDNCEKQRLRGDVCQQHVRITSSFACCVQGASRTAPEASQAKQDAAALAAAEKLLAACGEPTVIEEEAQKKSIITCRRMLLELASIKARHIRSVSAQSPLHKTCTLDLLNGFVLLMACSNDTMSAA